MLKKFIAFTFFFFCTTVSFFLGAQVTCIVHTIDETKKEVVISFLVNDKDFIYKDFILCSVYEHGVSLTSWKSDIQPIAYYDPIFQDTKYVFTHDFSITMTASFENPTLEIIHIYCSYYQYSEKKVNHVVFPLQISTKKEDNCIENISDRQKESKIIKNNLCYTCPFDDYYMRLINTVCNSITVVKSYYYTILVFLAIIIFIFSIIFYYTAERMKKRTKIYELFLFVFSLLIIGWIVLCIASFFGINPFLSIVANTFLLIVSGLLYMRQSDLFASESLRTISILAGIVCICASMILLFKAMQFW